MTSTTHLCRRNDPDTSYAAAVSCTASGRRKTQRELLFAALQRYPGHTSAELARICGIDRYAAARRLPDLRHDGFAENGDERICTVQGTLAITWYPAPPRQQRELFS